MNKVVSLVEEIAFGRIDRRLAEFLVASRHTYKCHYA